MAKLILLFSLTLTIMASCGQKGPLYLPDPKPNASSHFSVTDTITLNTNQ